MWIFAQKGFLSIVKHREKPGYLLVRARVKGDIEAYFPTLVEVDKGTDYKYRAILSVGEVSDRIGNIVGEIDYDNFKDNVHDQERRLLHYGRIWAIMRDLQSYVLMRRE